MTEPRLQPAVSSVDVAWDAAPSLDAARYLAASPWPHTVIDGLFDPEVVRAAEAEQLEVARTLRPHTSRRQIKAERSRITGPASEQLTGCLDGEPWIDLLGRLTGITTLHHDPSRFWAGLHVSPPGAFQSVHRDFQKHPATGLYHRVNVLLYLTSDWRQEEGAELELWSADLESCEKRILPVAGRLVIFESHPGTPHAVGRQTSPDPNRLRLSFAAYYYSPEPPAGGLKRRGTLLQPRAPGEPLSASLIDVADAARGATRRAGVLPARIGRSVRRRVGR